MGKSQCNSPLLVDDSVHRKMNFYSAWFCPYAQRAWITLEYHNIPYEYIESLSVKQNQSEGDHGYQKNPRLLEVNPRGLVPTLEFAPEAYGAMVDQGFTIQTVKDVAVLSESMVCMQFLNSIAPEKEKRNLIPCVALLSDAQRFNEKICSTFYEILMKPSREEQRLSFHNFASNIADFVSDVMEGGYYKSTLPTITDFTVIPWLLRLPVVKHYRPMFKLEEHVSETSYEKIIDYVQRMKELPAVRNTLWKDDKDLLFIYQRYADGTAESQVGQAVRGGGQAHNA